jgi:hypothetical protein
VLEAIKQFLARVTQRGFFPRSPSYTRDLNVLHLEDFIFGLARRGETSDALMVKKLNYTIFMDLKVFYENDMSENLYHFKKV